MEITRIRVSGFKSFSEPVELAIDSGLTGIVGPNGCGKSNIVEALRWAMGESSARGLRGDEMEDVIFSGTGARPAHDVAEVRLKVRGRAEGLAGLTAEDLEIARKIARGVGSTYRINGREARARDIQLLFADAGAGSRSPAIVGQGQIGFIVDAKASERRKLLEDAAGIGGLQTRRREAELKLEAARANLQRVLDLLGTQEARLGELRKQGRQAERYRKLAAELRQAEALLLLARHAAAADALARVTAEAQGAAAELEERGKAATALRAARDELAAALPGQRERTGAATAHAARLRERLAGLSAAAEREAAHQAALGRQSEEARADLARLEHATVELVAARTAAEAEAKDLDQDHESLGRELATAMAQEQSVAASLRAAQARMHEAVARAAESQALFESVQERLGGLQARREALARERAALPDLGAVRDVCGQAEARLASRRAELEEARASLAAAEAELHRLEPLREAQRGRHLAAEGVAADARQALAAAELRLREARAAAARLAERRAALVRSADRLAERRRSHEARAETLARSRTEADPIARGQELAAAEAELAAADAVLDAAREAAAGADHARSEAARSLREQHRMADAVAAEIKVLASLVQEAGTDGLLDAVHVPDDLAAAVAAALGDDLLAGTDPTAPCHWREFPGASGDGLPEGVPALLDLVSAPATLHRRLAQVGLVEADLGPGLQPRLAIGQCLVSREGGLWRWDGFVRAPGAEDSGAARVRHHLRLHAAREEADDLARRIAAGEASLEACEAGLGAARSDLAAAETRWRAADLAQTRARQRLDEAHKLATGQAVEAARLEEEAAALGHEAAEHASEATALEQLAGELAAVAALSTELEHRRAELAAAETALGDDRAEAERLNQTLEAANASVRTSRAGLEQARQAFEQARADAEQASRQAGEFEAAHRTREAAISADAESLETALSAAEAEAVSAREAKATRKRDRAEAEAGLAAAEEAARAAADRLTRLRAEAAGLERRAATLEARRSELEGRLAEADAARAELLARRERLESEVRSARQEQPDDPDELCRLEAQTVEAEAAAMAAREEQEERERWLAALEGELEAAEASSSRCRERLAVAQSERAHAETAFTAALAALEERLQQSPEMLLADAATRAAFEAASAPELEDRVARLRATRERLGPVNLRAEVEIAELEAALGETRAREAELQAAIDRLRAAITTLNKEGRERLMAVFTAVDGHFRRLFQHLFGGGRAHLRLAGADDPLQAGLELEASPPGKKLASISLLSGGEKTLTALALVFGFFLAQPSPLCVLDEVDAPLDDANVDRFVGLMQEIAQSTGTRFLVVTHHPLTMARMDRLYGVTMAERGISRLVSVALEQALELRATA